MYSFSLKVGNLELIIGEGRELVDGHLVSFGLVGVVLVDDLKVLKEYIFPVGLFKECPSWLVRFLPRLELSLGMRLEGEKNSC